LAVRKPHLSLCPVDAVEVRGTVTQLSQAKSAVAPARAASSAGPTQAGSELLTSMAWLIALRPDSRVAKTRIGKRHAAAFASYNKTWGSLAAVAITLTWFWLHTHTHTHTHTRSTATTGVWLFAT
jgi:hypothetical protein